MATDGVARSTIPARASWVFETVPTSPGRFFFRDGAALSGITIGKAFKDFDGCRRFRLRYDTPDFSRLRRLGLRPGTSARRKMDETDYYDIGPALVGYTGRTST